MNWKNLPRKLGARRAFKVNLTNHSLLFHRVSHVKNQDGDEDISHDLGIIRSELQHNAFPVPLESLMSNDQKIDYGKVFESQKFDSFRRAWIPIGLVLCSDPGTVVSQLFDPMHEAIKAESIGWWTTHLLVLT